ncbi:type II secretion system protein [Candidatus Saccharibacteria bacterium]|nr:type II secretion system protein [Candidatus Saccharibacteria bacterium]
MAQAKMLSQKSTLRGFTIIEVVLVLAIAGLIFLMVFIALPALQRSQRDTQRRDDLARVATAINNYSSNNNGALPTTSTFAVNTTTLNHGANQRNTATGLVSNYLNEASATTNSFLDPDGTPYGVAIASGALTVNAGAVDHIIHVQTGTHCGTEGQAAALNNQPRKYSVLYILENGVYCADNS